MAARHLIAPLAIACTLLAGCGSSAHAPPAYVATGNAICTTQLALLHKLRQPSTAGEAASYLPQAITIMNRVTTQLAPLQATAPEHAELTAAIASTRQLSGALADLLHQLRGGIIELSTLATARTQTSTLRAALDTHFRAAGISRCVQ